MEEGLLGGFSESLGWKTCGNIDFSGGSLLLSSSMIGTIFAECMNSAHTESASTARLDLINKPHLIPRK